MKKTVIALILILSMLLTTACALKGGADANNAADGGNEEATTPIDDNVKDPEPKIYNPAEFSFGEGVPSFDSSSLNAYFKELNTKIENSDYIEINAHPYVKMYSAMQKLTYEEKDGKFIYKSVANSAHLVYVMFLSAVMNQYPENCVTYDYDYDYYSSNIEPSHTLFVSFDYDKTKYEKLEYYLEELLKRNIEYGNNSYRIGYYYCHISRAQSSVNDYSDKVLESLGYK